MAEYIERDKAIEAVRSDPMGGLNYKRILTDIPAADVVPVVRCKDCKHHGFDTEYENYWCNLTSGVRKVDSDDFCSRGERKES